MSNSHCVQIETTTTNDNIVVIHRVLATSQLATWHPESPMLLLMCLALIQLVTWRCHIVLAVLVLGNRWWWWWWLRKREASSILFLSFRGHSFCVIPGTIPAECEFCSTFRQNSFINLAGNCAKIDSYGILGIDRIPPDSGRNQWKTVKTSLNANQNLTLEILQALLWLKPKDITKIFWDLHSIIHIPVFDTSPIHFYHVSLWDFLMDWCRSCNLYIDGVKAHSLLLKMCIQTLTDFHGGSTWERTTGALLYSRNYWVTHYNYGDTLDPGILDKVLEEHNPETWLPLDSLSDATSFTSWWNGFALLWDRFHGRVSVFIYLV